MKLFHMENPIIDVVVARFKLVAYLDTHRFVDDMPEILANSGLVNAALALGKADKSIGEWYWISPLYDAETAWLEIYERLEVHAREMVWRQAIDDLDELR